MKIKDAARMFATELGLKGRADEAERFCDLIQPGAGDVDLNEQEVKAAREIFRQILLNPE